ncbi:MAG: hypothetical protein ABIH41_07245 [Nanoarchaeota archaeon]
MEFFDQLCKCFARLQEWKMRDWINSCTDQDNPLRISIMRPWSTGLFFRPIDHAAWTVKLLFLSIFAAYFAHAMGAAHRALPEFGALFVMLTIASVLVFVIAGMLALWGLAWFPVALSKRAKARQRLRGELESADPAHIQDIRVMLSKLTPYVDNLVWGGE